MKAKLLFDICSESMCTARFSDNKEVLFPCKVAPLHLMRGSGVRNFVYSLSKEFSRGEEIQTAL